MTVVADLDRLYQRNAPVAAGGKVERAIQFIRFCGSLYRELRVSYPDVTWDRQLALEVQGLVLRARDALDLGSFAFLSGDQEPHAFWSESSCVLQACAAARSAQRGHIADVLIAGSLLSNGFHYSYSDDPSASLAEGYATLLPTLAVLAAPLVDLSRLAEFDVPAWFDYDGDRMDAGFGPAIAALRPDADPENRRLLLESASPSTRDAILAVRASLGLPVEPDEARGDMRAMAHYMGIVEESGSDADLRWVRAWMCLIYLAARDIRLLLAQRPKQIKSEVAWVSDWYGREGWPPFPS